MGKNKRKGFEEIGLREQQVVGEELTEELAGSIEETRRGCAKKCRKDELMLYSIVGVLLISGIITCSKYINLGDKFVPIGHLSFNSQY